MLLLRRFLILTFPTSLSVSNICFISSISTTVWFFFPPLNIWIHPSRDTLTTSLLPSCWNPSGLTAHKYKCQSELKFGWRWSGGVNTVPFAKLPTRTYAQTSRFCRFHRAIPGRLKISVAVGGASKRHQAGLWWQQHKTRWFLVKGVVSYISLLLHWPSTEPGVTMATGCWEIAERESAGWSQWAFSFSKPGKISREQNPKARTTCSFLTATDVGGGSGKWAQQGL